MSTDEPTIHIVTKILVQTCFKKLLKRQLCTPHYKYIISYSLQLNYKSFSLANAGSKKYTWDRLIKFYTKRAKSVTNE